MISDPSFTIDVQLCLYTEIGKPLQEEAEAVLQLIGDLYKAIKRSVAEPTSRSEPNVVHPTTRNSAVDLNAMVESIFKCQRDEYLHVLKTRLQVFTDKLRSSANETNEDYLSGSAMNYLSGINHRTLLALYRKRGHHQDNLGIWHNLNNALADAALGPVYGMSRHTHLFHVPSLWFGFLLVPDSVEYYISLTSA